MNLVCYLARPIDQAHGTAARRFLDEREQWLRKALTAEAGFHVYCPARAWTVGQGPPDPRIEQVNRVALCNADLVVALLPPDVPTVGVPMEIADACHLGIPVVVFTGQANRSYALAGRAGVTLADDLMDVPALALKQVQERPRQSAVSQLRLVLDQGADPPALAYPGDVGLDLVTAANPDGYTDLWVVPAGGFVDVATQVRGVQMPDGHWGLITGRSSTLRTRGLHVPVAVIDGGWRGPLFVGVWNLGNEPQAVQPGDRLGQLILMPNYTEPTQVVRAEQIDPHPRGLNGFGSTDREPT